MENELNVKQLQKESGIKIKEELSKKLDGIKVDVAYANSDYISGKGFAFYIYHNKNNYDYKKINVNYVEEAKVIDYVLFILECLNKNDENVTEHIATAEEKYIIDILNKIQAEKLYIFDGCLYGNGYEIGLDDVDYIAHDKINNILEIYSDEEKFEIDLLDGTIESEEDDNGEPITVNFIEKVVEKFNELNYWCKLFCDRDMIYIRDKETNNIQELVAIDDMDYVSLKNRKLFVSHSEDEYGFDSFTINEDGIEM